MEASPPDFLSVSECRTYAELTFPKRRREWLLGRWTAKRLLQLSQVAYRECHGVYGQKRDVRLRGVT